MDTNTVSYFNFMHNTTAKFTFFLWYKKTTGEPDDLYCLFTNNNGTSTNRGIFIAEDDRSSVPRSRNIYFFITRGVASSPVIEKAQDNTSPNDTNWNCLAITYDQSLGSSNAQLFVNGSSAWTANKTANTPSNSDASANTEIGSYDGGSLAFGGELSNVVIWNSALTSNQIGALYRGVNPFPIDPTNKKAHYPIDGNESPESQYVTQIHKGTLSGTSKASTNPSMELLENYL